ncbi:unnamed protein product [marine sediment metagenome]|uniref:Uncharacterized protein n=1 Tax=marine sediment metagenome TaxID=412755 RepID=X1RF75_9ZZZZ
MTIDNDKFYRNGRGKLVKLVKNEFSNIEPEKYEGLNPWSKEGNSFNLVEQCRIAQANPKLARFLKEQVIEKKWNGHYTL